MHSQKKGLEQMIAPQHDNISITETINYLSQGIKLALSKECRLYIIIPVTVNLVLMSILGYFLFTSIKDWVFGLVDMWPDFLIFLAYIFSAIFAILIIFVGCYLFSTIATIIASPFYGLLADKVEMKLNGTQSDDMGFIDIIKDIPRILKREFQKQLFFIPLAFLCLIVTFIPVINIISPVLWFLLTSWMGCLQYCDYAYDNHKISFSLMKKDLKHNSLPTFTFGALVSLALPVPILNILIPPAAVCAGTCYYLEMQKRYNLSQG